MGDSIISSFQRYEVKYFLTPEQRASLMPVLEAHFQMDEYGLHTISNLYYDTDNYEITRNSIDRPVYKKKYEHVVYKRRIALPVAEADRLLNHGEDPPGADPQITHEIRHFMEHYQPKPKVYLSYRRIAMAGIEDPELRITMDQELLWRTEDLDLTHGSYGRHILPEETTLMEIKVPGAMPLWLARALSDRGIYRTSFSNIGACYTRFILPTIFEEKGVTPHV